MGGRAAGTSRRATARRPCATRGPPATWSRAAGLVWSGVPGCYGRGRIDVLAGWLDGFGTDELAASSRLALAAAWCALERDGALVEAWMAAAEHSAGGEAELPAGARAAARRRGA